MEQFPHFAFWQDLGNLVAVSEKSLYISSLTHMVGQDMTIALSLWTRSLA